MRALEGLAPYAATLLALGAMAALLLVQLVVADVAGIRAGHEPGSPVEPDHGSFLFRAVRAHANTNESLSAFVLLALFGLLSAASPGWLGLLAWLFVAARAAHMACYYANLKAPRSVAFAVGLLALLGMLAVGVGAWL